jgi:hypothetical protein
MCANGIGCHGDTDGARNRNPRRDSCEGALGGVLFESLLGFVKSSPMIPSSPDRGDGTPDTVPEAPDYFLRHELQRTAELTRAEMGQCDVLVPSLIVKVFERHDDEPASDPTVEPRVRPTPTGNDDLEMPTSRSENQ